MEATYSPAPALPADAQDLCNHAVKLGLYPLIRDTATDPDDPDLGTLVEVAFLPRFDAAPDPYGWTLAADPNNQFPPTMHGPVLAEDTCGGEWTGYDRIRAALTRYAAPKRQEVTP